MAMKLLLITSQYFYQFTIDALARLNLPCETKVVPYDDFGHIPVIYGTYADQYDACLTSGIVAMNAIRMVYPHPPKPLTYFQVSENGLHRDILKVILETQNMDLSRIAMDFMVAVGDEYSVADFLKVILETQNMDLSRIAMDFMVAVGDGYSVADFLKVDELDQVYGQNTFLTQQIGIRAGCTVEHMVLEKIIKLWDEGVIDLVICQYSSIVPMLQARGIPFRCPFVSDHRLNAIIQDTLIKLELRSLHNNHPAIIQIFPRHSADVTKQHIQTIHSLMQTYIGINLIDCVLQESGSCCVMISSLGILRFLTDDFQKCRICSWLEQQLDFSVSVAYGIGTTVPHAMNNVQLASKEAKLLGKSFVVDSNGNLIGPLNSEHRMVITANSLPDVAEIARQCNLSAMTVQKLMAIVQRSDSNKITTPDLAGKLDTTIRNANRIMLNLCKGNIAKPVYTQSTHSRGRPIQVYALNFETRNG